MIKQGIAYLNCKTDGAQGKKNRDVVQCYFWEFREDKDYNTNSLSDWYKYLDARGVKYKVDRK